mgnify:CR=1 FL=1
MNHSSCFVGGIEVYNPLTFPHLGATLRESLRMKFKSLLKGFVSQSKEADIIAAAALFGCDIP